MHANLSFYPTVLISLSHFFVQASVRTNALTVTMLALSPVLSSTTCSAITGSKRALRRLQPPQPQPQPPEHWNGATSRLLPLRFLPFPLHNWPRAMGPSYLWGAWVQLGPDPPAAKP